MPPRILYSFPHRIGAQRICLTAWQQAVGASRAGARMMVLCGSVARPLPNEIHVLTTLALGKLRLPHRLLGRFKTLQLHDWLTARWLDAHHDEIDAVHGWPGASLRTIETARRHGIPTALERPNAHTAYAFEAAAEECRHCNTRLAENHDHAFNARSLGHELHEYEAADFLLCPSDFVARTFLDRSTPPAKIFRHHYGFDENRFFPNPEHPPVTTGRPLTAIYAGVCEPRKGLHYALQAWRNSAVSKHGTFLICGEFVPGYHDYLKPWLDHPGVKILGHRMDLPELMRAADLFVIASVEEGSALVTYEARASGCVVLASDASGAPCSHETNSLIHPMRDDALLTEQLDRLEHDRRFLATLRAQSLATCDKLTWDAAGIRLKSIYDRLAANRRQAPATQAPPEP